MKEEERIIVTKNGPYQIKGKIPLAKEISKVGKDGNPEKWEKGEKYPYKKEYFLCRCGKSKNKPFCDGSHISSKFDGTETATRKKDLEEIGNISGPNLNLIDIQKLCAGARFCHRAEGVWNLVKKSDDKSKKIAIEEACNCPSGRLVVCDKKTGKSIEPKFKQEISLIEDEGAKVSGPIWVKGKIKIESSYGKEYEPRNRVTLCRCGRSNNKPFCDGTHLDIKFSDKNHSRN